MDLNELERFQKLEQENVELKDRVQELENRLGNYSEFTFLCDNIQKWIVEEYSTELQKWITDSYSPVLQEWIEEYVDEKINTALLNIPKDKEQHTNYSDGEWKVYRIKEIGQRLNDLGLTDKWHSYTYLYPEVYLTKEAAEKHKPSDLHCDTAHTTYEIIEQTVIYK